MTWTDAWVGLGWESKGRGPDKYDCLGFYLALLSYRKGIVLPDPMVSRGAIETARLSLYRHVQLVSVGAICEGDALVFRTRPGRLHIGYALDDHNMLHAHRDVMGTVVDRFTGFKWRCKLAGVYRPHA